MEHPRHRPPGLLVLLFHVVATATHGHSDHHVHFRIHKLLSKVCIINLPISKLAALKMRLAIRDAINMFYSTKFGFLQAYKNPFCVVFSYQTCGIRFIAMKENRGENH
jgi:uncharacterized ion transporter superfamily protein YfcC